MPLRVVTFKIEEELLERLDKYCKEKGLPRSSVIREAIIMYLHEKERKIIGTTRRIRVWT